MSRSCRLAKELSQLFGLKGKFDPTISVSIYYINQFMDSERSSIWLYQNSNQRLSIFSSLDLEKDEISIPKFKGLGGWVFTHRKSAVVNNVYEDDRFYKEVDNMTGFFTRNMICAPLLVSKDDCLGTLQSMNKKTGDFTANDLELLNLVAGMAAVAISKSGLYDEILKG